MSACRHTPHHTLNSVERVHQTPHHTLNFVNVRVTSHSPHHTLNFSSPCDRLWAAFQTPSLSVGVCCSMMQHTHHTHDAAHEQCNPTDSEYDAVHDQICTHKTYIHTHTHADTHTRTYVHAHKHVHSHTHKHDPSGNTSCPLSQKSFRLGLAV